MISSSKRKINRQVHTAVIDTSFQTLYRLIIIRVDGASSFNIGGLGIHVHHVDPVISTTGTSHGSNGAYGIIMIDRCYVINLVQHDAQLSTSTEYCALGVKTDKINMATTTSFFI